MRKRTNNDGTKVLGPVNLSSDPMKMRSAVDGRWLRALIEEFSTSTIYLGVTSDGIDPHNKWYHYFQRIHPLADFSVLF